MFLPASGAVKQILITTSISFLKRGELDSDTKWPINLETAALIVFFKTAVERIDCITAKQRFCSCSNRSTK